MPDWKGSNRAQRLPANWKAIREKRLELDGYKCQYVIQGRPCGRPATEVDHKRAKTDDHSLDALQSLCSEHHGRKSGHEGGVASRKAYWAKINKSKQKFRRTEKHPGEL